MNTISTPARITSAVFAVLTSAVILGSTVVGITSGANEHSSIVIALERAPAAATASN
jgi:hypothetical protein